MATMNRIFADYEARQEVLASAQARNPLANGIAWIAGELVPYHEARIPLKDQGFLHSDLTYE